MSLSEKRADQQTSLYCHELDPSPVELKCDEYFTLVITFLRFIFLFLYRVAVNCHSENCAKDEFQTNQK